MRNSGRTKLATIIACGIEDARSIRATGGPRNRRKPLVLRYTAASAVPE